MTRSRRTTPVTQLIAVRQVRRDVPSAATVVTTVTSAHDHDPGKPKIARNDSDARAVLSMRWSGTPWLSWPNSPD